MTRDAYRKVAKIAGDLLNRFMRRGDFPSAHGKCVDCGFSHFLVWDHRSYDHIFQVEPVCRSCNATRGPGSVSFLDVTTGLTTVWHPKRLINTHPPSYRAAA